MSRFAVANHIPHKLVDGNDVLSILKASEELIDNSRNGEGPGFLEVITYRWYGHVDWRQDIDVGVNRSLDDVDNWKARDPIKRLYESMLSKGFTSELKVDDYSSSLDSRFILEWEKALKDPYPKESSIMERVYKDIKENS
jgi:pyruvate dehydrogenase E1 component alpha subunit